MVPQTKWTERNFNFDFPVWEFAAIIERLKYTPRRLQEKIIDIPFMILELPYNNGWSIQEHAGHLIDLEILHNKRLDEYEAGAELLSPADMENKLTNAANYNDKSIRDILETFSKVRNDFIERVSNYDEEMAARTALHPRLKQPMRLVDMLYFVAEHDDHHLAIITSAQRTLT